jgi:hypothetical protein
VALMVGEVAVCGQGYIEALSTSSFREFLSVKAYFPRMF